MKTFQFFLAAGLIICALFLLISPARADFSGTVVSITDGDTLKVETEDGEVIKIRLWGIDCPEFSKDGSKTSQPYGKEAYEFTTDLALNHKVQIIEHGTSYERIVGEVILEDGTFLNKEILKSGFAWWYHNYCKELEWAQLEAEARINGTGLWESGAPVPPWVFRNKESLEKEGAL